MSRAFVMAGFMSDVSIGRNSLAIGTLCCLLAFGAAADEMHVALVKSVTGSVGVVRDGQELIAQRGMRLLKSDRILAHEAATAGIVFKDGTLLSVGPGSDIAIRDYAFEPGRNDFAFALYMAKGTAVYSSGRIGKLAPESVDISTPRATVGVRGTRFIITAEQ